MNLSRLVHIVCFLGITLLTQCTTHVEENAGQHGPTLSQQWEPWGTSA